MAEAAGSVKIIFAADATSYSAALTAMQKQMDSFAAKAGIAGRRGAAAGHGMVAPWQASSAALRVAEGNMTNNIRAAERFLATIPGVGKALQVAFPVVGAIALVGVFGKMIDGVTEFIKKTEKIPQALDNAFRETVVSGQLAADQLRKENDLLDNQIAKFEGLPQNNLASAIDDARIAADKLEQSLMRDNRQIAEMLKANQIGWIGSLLTGKDSTTDLAGTVNYWNQELANFGKKYDDAMHMFGPGSQQAQQAKTALDRRRADAEYRMQGEIWERTPGPNRAPNITGDQTANLNIARGYLAILQQQDQMEQLDDAHAQKQRKADKLRHAKELATSEKEAAAERMAQARANLEAMKADHAMSLDEEAAYWQKLADHAKRGSTLYNAELMEVNKARAAIVKQQQKDWSAMVATFTKENSPAALLGGGTDAERRQNASEYLLGNWTRDQRDDEEAQRKLEEAAMRAFEAAERQRQTAERLAEERIRLQAETGQLSRAGAAQALQTLHEENFAQWSSASHDFSAQFPNLAVPGAAEMLDRHDEQAMQDEAAMQAATAMGALREATDQMTQRFQDLPSKLVDLSASTVEGFNETFSGSVMAHARTGWEYRRNMENALGGEFRRLGSSGLNAALQLGEGSLLKRFGFGGKKDGSSEASALWVRLAGLGNAAAGLSVSSVTPGSNVGLMKAGLSIALSAVPGLAAGGPIPSNMPAIVGERGPELFLPATSGRIVPNHQLAFGSQTHLSVAVDARGASDPAAVEAAAHRAVMAAAPHIVTAALAAQHDDRRRSPLTRSR